MKSVLIVALIGLPGSGKSRLCFQLLSEAEKSKEIGVFIVDFDKIIGRNLRLDEGEKIWKSRRRKILLGLRKSLNGLWASHQEEEVNGEEEAEEAILEGLLDWRRSIKFVASFPLPDLHLSQIFLSILGMTQKPS